MKKKLKMVNAVPMIVGVVTMGGGIMLILESIYRDGVADTFAGMIVAAAEEGIKPVANQEK